MIFFFIEYGFIFLDLGLKKVFNNLKSLAEINDTLDTQGKIIYSLLNNSFSESIH